MGCGRRRPKSWSWSARAPRRSACRSSASRVDVARHRRGAGLQDAARRARLGALTALATERGARRVALGHQADDQAETVLFRIVRGTGLAGLQGIPYRRDPFVRPLLDLPRAEILRYLRRRSIPFVEDPFQRRPALRAGTDPPPPPAGAGRGESARRGGAGGAGRGGTRGAAGARRQPHAGRGACAVAAGGGGGGPPARAGGNGGRRYRGRTTGGGLVRRRAGGGARVGPAARARRAGRCESTGPGPIAGRPARSTSRRAPGGGRAPRAESRAEFDADLLEWPLTARARKSGDRMRPRGGRGSRKLSDLMIDARIARATRGGAADRHQRARRAAVRSRAASRRSPRAQLRVPDAS